MTFHRSRTFSNDRKFLRRNPKRSSIHTSLKRERRAFRRQSEKESFGAREARIFAKRRKLAPANVYHEHRFRRVVPQDPTFLFPKCLRVFSLCAEIKDVLGIYREGDTYHFSQVFLNFTARSHFFRFPYFSFFYYHTE